MSVFDDMLAANDRHAGGADEAGPAARELAIVTCMDARIVPAAAFGAAELDAQIIRNAGGRAADAVRSLVVSQRLLGTTAVAVIHHTRCGMQTFTNEDLYAKVKEDLGAEAGHIDFLPFTELEQSVRDDVQYLRDSPLIAPDVEVRGYVYDVDTHRLSEVT